MGDSQFRVTVYDDNTTNVTLEGYFPNLFAAIKYAHSQRLYPSEVVIVSRRFDPEFDKWFVVYSRRGKGR